MTVVDPTTTETSARLPASLGSAKSTDTVTSFPIEKPRLKVRRNLRARNFRSQPGFRSQTGHRSGRASSEATAALSLPYFIVGPENRLVTYLATDKAGVLAMANPLLITGASGVGKSTLALHLAAQESIRSSSNGVSGETIPDVVHYLTANDFARQYAEAIQADDLMPLQSEIDDVAVLVVDDLHLMAEKSAAQEELAIRIERRVEQGRLTIITCRRLPSDTRGLRPRLVSRTLGGLNLFVKSPGPATQRVLLRELSLLHDCEIGIDLIDLLNEGLPEGLTIRHLAACVKQMMLWSRMNDCEVNVQAVQFALDSLHQQAELSIAEITRSVAKHFRLKTSDLRSSSRRQKIVRARSLAMTLARQLTNQSLHQIGEAFGGRDHSTVLHAIRKTESLLHEDADLRRAAAEVTEKLSA